MRAPGPFAALFLVFVLFVDLVLSDRSFVLSQVVADTLDMSDGFWPMALP